jgi:SAM-dependent methyltransferase
VEIVDSARLHSEARLLSKLSCPYHPDEPLVVDSAESALACAVCKRSFPWQGACFDLRSDELRSGTSPWRPGDPGWDDRLFRRFGGRSTVRPDPLRDPSLETLDIGCGARPAGDFNLDAYVPDPLPANFVLGSADRLPYLQKSFDVVVSRYVIEHLTDPPKFIRDCVRLARREVVIATDNADWLGELVFRFIGRGRIFHPEHVYKWSVEYFRNLFERVDGVRANVRLDTLSDTPIVRLMALAARGPVFGPLLHRDLVARIAVPPDVSLDAPGASGSAAGGGPSY